MKTRSVVTGATMRQVCNVRVCNTGGHLLFEYVFPTYQLLCGDIVADRDDNEFIIVRRKWDRWGEFNLIVECYPQPSKMREEK